jgi:hypothetical protein
MRGNLKNDEYFEEKLTKSDEDVTHYEELVAKVRAERGENDRGVKNGYGILSSTYLNRMNLLYTSGTRDNEFRPAFENLLRYYAKTWEPDDSYFELIKVISLAIILDVDSTNEWLLLLERKISENNYSDYLVDRFLTVVDSKWERRCSVFKWDNTYEPIKAIVDCEDKTQAVMLLRSYLENQWYDIHKECAWHGTHKSPKTVYYGYWSFEAGAITKVCNLDDSLLKGQVYYPYDLVHSEGA